jgi:ABC-type xylose transport system permease subunit
MSSNSTSTWRWLTALILAHLVVSIVHGAAHGGAHVPMSLAANLFVATVIVAGPLVGLALAWRAERFGSWVIATTMAGALAFGGVNHFVIAGPDHVARVNDDWRLLFTITAVLLAVTEGLAFALALELARGRKRVS